MSADLIGDDACREAFNKARQQRFSVHGLDVVCEPDIFRAGYAAGRDSEIAKRDARMAEFEKELQAGATAVENCDLFRAMLAAPAAPAADAYSWRRKEGVNGIKEFMAQKCYDAQTDAIKKYYEPFKCANCKAADAGLVEALEHARLFIVNGIDLGFIQMPEADTPDPAHETLPMIDAALAAHRTQGAV